MSSQNDIRQAITNQIITALESGNVPPWRRPWKIGKNAGAPANVVSKRSYRGLNPILLAIHAEKHQTTSKWYGTFNQWKTLSGKVMRRPTHVPEGHWGCQIVFWSPVTKTVHTDDGDMEDRFFVLRMYTVFNIDQVEGEALDHLRAGQPDTDESPVIDYQPAEEAVEAARFGMNLRVKYGGGKAFYSPSQDYVQIPPKATFESLSEYYGTVFHELVHATEHESRLNWSRKDKDKTYAFGELIAELGGVFACRELGVPASDDLTNHVAYLGNWLQAMRNDSRFIITASSQASKAASYILSFSTKAEEVVQEDGELVSA